MDLGLTDVWNLLESPVTWVIFVFGACVGSFLNVCIYRIPRNIFFKSSRSFCPNCEKEVPIWFNMPIISWLILRGRARCCGESISIQYPLVELFTALMFVVMYWRFPFVQSYIGGLVIDSEWFLRFSHAAIFFSLLLVCSVIDIHLQIIPDKLSLPMIALAPVVAALHPELTLVSSLLGIVIGGGSLYLVAWLYYLVRREIGLGFGDVKLLAAIGGWLGYESIFATVFISSTIGSIIGILVMIVLRSSDMKIKLPFGPFLSLGAMTYLLFGQTLQELFFVSQ